MKRYLSFALLLFSLKSNGVEYVCWQQMELQGMAFEASALNCPGRPKKEKGSVAQNAEMRKAIVCIIPAVCLALTPRVSQLLIEKTGLQNIEDIKKLDSKLIQTALMNTPFIGRPSSVVCEGRGSAKADDFGKLGLTDAACPNFTACANSDEIFYNMAVTPPTNQTSPQHVYGTSPMKITPTEVQK